MKIYKNGKEALDDYLAFMRTARAAATCETERLAIRKWLLYLKEKRIHFRQATRDHLLGFLNAFGWKERRKYEMLHPIKKFYNYLITLAYTRNNPADTIIIQAPRRRPFAYDVPSPAKINGLFKKLERETSPRAAPRRLRNLLLLELIYGSGLRRRETASLNVEDIDTENGVVHVLGKGNKERVVPVTSRAIDVYRRYVKVRSTQRGPLFLSRNGNRRICSAQISTIFREKLRMHPHLFRHACATHMLQNGCNVKFVQALLGHSSLGTTEFYTHLNRKNLEEIVQKKHPRKVWKKNRLQLNMELHLTNPQKELLHEIRAFVQKKSKIDDQQIPFTRRDLIRITGDYTSIAINLRALEKAGYIEIVGGGMTGRKYLYRLSEKRECRAENDKSYSANSFIDR